MMRCNSCTALVPDNILTEHATCSHDGYAMYTSIELDAAPPQPAHIKLDRQSCSVAELIANIYRELSPFRGEREVSFKFEAFIYPRQHVVYGSLARPENN